MKGNRTKFIDRANPPSRTLAIAAGELKYKTSKPCKRGHLSDRFVSSGACVDCLKELTKTPAFIVKRKDHYKRKIEHIKTRTASYRELNRLTIRIRKQRKYGLSPDQYKALLASQNNCCAICELPLDLGKRTHTDHCHETNKVRGILCHHCNSGIGLLKHSPELMRRAIAYVLR